MTSLKHISVVMMLIAVATLLNSAACNRMSATNGKAATGAASEEEHDHFPAHWPSTIFLASERLAAFQKSPSNGSLYDGVSRDQELIDLVRWLPDLAADSDLDEATFNKIDSWSRDYLQKLEAKRNEGAKLEKLLAIEGLSQMIVELQDIVQKEAARITSAQGK